MSRLRVRYATVFVLVEVIKRCLDASDATKTLPVQAPPDAEPASAATSP